MTLKGELSETRPGVLEKKEKRAYIYFWKTRSNFKGNRGMKTYLETGNMNLPSGFYTNNTLQMAHCIGTCKEEDKDQESIQSSTWAHPEGWGGGGGGGGAWGPTPTP